MTVIVQGTPVPNQNEPEVEVPFGAALNTPGSLQPAYPYGNTTTTTTSYPPIAAAVPAPATVAAVPLDSLPPPVNYGQMGTKQETRCRDPLFAVLFIATVAAVAAAAILTGPGALDNATDADADADAADSGFTPREYDGYVYAALICTGAAFLFSVLGVFLLMAIPQTLIKVSLFLTVVLAGIMMFFGFASGNFLGGLFGAIFFAITLCYARAVWPRIPFATINLVTAITAIRSNLGVVAYAYAITLVSAAYTVAWSFAAIGTYDETVECDEETDICGDPNYGYLFLLFVAILFAQQVFQNTIQVIVAGTVGHWWFEPAEAQACCSPAVNGAFVRATTTSFGSICFGSLIVAVLEALKALANAARQNDDAGFLACLAECILGCLASLVEYFNRWAYIYVGIYGYSYLEAGKNVFSLFRNRGWEAIIADSLIDNTLSLLCLLVGGVIGGIGLLVEATTDFFDDAGGSASVIAFGIGFIIGLVICRIGFSTIDSGVNAVIVLFAEAPADFQRNYPDLSNQMRQEWARVYPGSI